MKHRYTSMPVNIFDSEGVHLLTHEIRYVI